MTEEEIVKREVNAVKEDKADRIFAPFWKESYEAGKEGQVPLTAEQLRFYKKNYDKIVDLALSEARENPKFTSMDPMEKTLTLYDAKKKAEEELRRQAQAI